MKTETRKDLYAQITNAIIEELEHGTMPWSRTWVSTTPQCRPFRANGEPYRGINILLLWLAAARRGFESPFWITYRQASEIGGQVRRGEKGTPIVFFTTLTKLDEHRDADDDEKKFPCLKTYSVFNASQIEQLPDSFFPALEKPNVPTFENSPIDAIESFFKKAGIQIEHGGDIPHYSPTNDRVQMPPMSAFRSVEDYYAVLAHESIHWVGHPSRQPRKFPGRACVTQNYAREELVAELGSAFLCADLGLTRKPRPDHAAYIEGWLEILRHDKRAIFHAASMAQKATDYLHMLQDPRAEEALECRR